MPQQFVETHLGIHTADAEGVALAFDRGCLSVRFLDWMDRPCELRLPETLAFRWQDDDDGGAPRDDMTYELPGSPWLEEQLHRSGVADVGWFRHYRLCFNACGSLDVVCRAVVASAA